MLASGTSSAKFELVLNNFLLKEFRGIGLQTEMAIFIVRIAERYGCSHLPDFAKLQQRVCHDCSVKKRLELKHLAWGTKTPKPTTESECEKIAEKVPNLSNTLRNDNCTDRYRSNCGRELEAFSYIFTVASPTQWVDSLMRQRELYGEQLEARLRQILNGALQTRDIRELASVHEASSVKS
eukprot:6486177-Amphidinium_carterae.1